MLDKKNFTFTIPDDYATNRLDHALVKLLPDYSRSQIAQWIKNGNVLVNGDVAKAKTKVKGGESIAIEVLFKPSIASSPQDIPLSIIYEDEELLIINKPVGMVVHPGAGNADQTLLNALLFHAPQLRALPRAGILHRLDKNTSGLLVIAKTITALKHLSHQLKKRTLVREYQAIVQGILISGGKVDAPLARHPIERKRMGVIETGKAAITHYRVAEKYRAHTRLKIRLETGRTHQIRVHMAHIRHPIVGDATYGGRLQLVKHMQPALITVLRQFKRQALHAFALELVHPVSNEMMHFEVDPPQDMQDLITALRNDSTRT